ncbi:sulfite exporter TauE/SafE family protein [Streptomyces sp. NBC_00523]|uniref:sulfite exporter TauE/SafE family protein n=1 Tax=Streptomyces sp. NBC_00523 TaxID=2975765 RepID=UPI002E817163|nr:sulfite exporter TauE/SafE family protein [Streptomyces sp. NBC_00523]WUC98302.1 sulfite exporter TauE/SafE family protein [Streptomyces sp. NBC_00523]
MTLPELLAVAAVALGAFAQAATGMGFSLIAAPVLIAVFGPHRGVPMVLVLAVVSSLLPLSRDWRHARQRDVGRLLLPAILGTPVAAWALRAVDTRLLALAAGCGVLIGVVLLARGVRSSFLSSPKGAWLAGLGSAGLNVIGGVGGPPIGLYAANAGWAVRDTRATLHAFFLVQNLVTAAVLGFVLPPWTTVAALAFGAAAGMVSAPRLPARAVRAGVLAVSCAGGVTLLGSALA